MTAQDIVGYIHSGFLFLFAIVVVIMASILLGIIRMRKSCEDLCCPCDSGPHPQKKTLKLKASFNPGSAIISVEGIEMSIVARNDQVVTFSAAFTDEFDNPVQVLGSNPVWSLSNNDVATLAVSEDGLQAVVTPTGSVGIVQLNLLVDADPGEAEEPLIGIADIQIVAGKARIIKLVGLVSDKPAVVVPEPETPVEPEPETPADPKPVAPVEQNPAEGTGEQP